MPANIGNVGEKRPESIYLDSLAQGRNLRESVLESPIRDTRKALQRRAFRKRYSLPLHTRLAELENERKQYYRNGIYCAEHIEQGEDGRLRTHYCNGRLCPICQAIRTAKAMNRYLPLIESFADPHFLTLTRRTVQGADLRTTIRHMTDEFKLITDLARKRNKVHGLRKLEVTYNGETDRFHPHFHMILDEEDAASFLLEQWLKRNRSSAHPDGQEIRPMQPGDTTEARILFGYVTKLATKIRNDSFPVPAASLDVIVAALFKKRTLQPYGNLLQGTRGIEEVCETDSVAYESPVASSIGKRILWEWEQEAATWIDRQTGELLVQPTTSKG